MNRLKIVETDLSILRDGWLGRFNYAFGGALRPGDERQIQAEVTFIGHAQERMVFDEYFNQSFLQGAIGNVLDAYGERVATTRLQGSAAMCYMTFYTQSPLNFDLEIPKGTRITADSKVYFATEATGYVRRGDKNTIIKATATTNGLAANRYEAGEIDILVDNIAFVGAVSNASSPTGGADIEPDESYRERIRFAYAKTTTAGSEESYIYWAKTASGLVGDVVVESPTPGAVVVSFLTTQGKPPGAELVKLVESVLNGKTIRPMTDLVTIKAPTPVEFEIEADIYIEDLLYSQNLQAVKDAVEKYIEWQTTKIGLSISPDMLTKHIIDAGAVIADIMQPIIYVQIGKSDIATLAKEPVLNIKTLSERSAAHGRS